MIFLLTCQCRLTVEFAMENDYTLNPKIQNNIAGPAIAQWLTRKNSETTMILVGIVEKAAFGQLIL